MSWRGFVDFWLMLEMGNDDATYRNYDLLRYARAANCDLTWLLLGIRRADLFVPGVPSEFLVADGQRRLLNMGFHPDSLGAVRIRLLEYYPWDSIRTGEYRKWPYRKGLQSASKSSPSSSDTTCPTAPSADVL